MRIAIAEDEIAGCELLKKHLEEYSKAKGVTFEIDYFSNGLDLVEAYKPDYDLLLLDIEMPRLNGMEAAQRIRRQDQDVYIIFITNMAKYAIRGYEVNALDYMLKPVNYFAFAMKMDKVTACLARREKRSMVFSTEDGLIKLAEEEIAYIEAVNHRLLVHTPGRCYTARGTLSELEQRLDGGNFVRCNKGYLVNLRHISRVKADTVVVAGDELVIARRRRDAFLLAVTDYYGGGGK